MMAAGKTFVDFCWRRRWSFGTTWGHFSPFAIVIRPSKAITMRNPAKRNYAHMLACATLEVVYR